MSIVMTDTTTEKTLPVYPNEIDGYNEMASKVREEHPDWSDDQIKVHLMSQDSVAESNDLTATVEEQRRIDEYKASENLVVDLAIATLDPKDMLKKYAKLGKAALDLASKRKASFKAWNGKDDFEKVCSDIETLVKMRVAIKEIRIATYVRIYLWVEAVKAIVPNVEKLSYFVVANKFLPTLQFDPVELTGEIKKDWLTWARVTAERQLGEEPMSVKAIDASIAARKEEIDRERLARSKRTPEEALEAELKAANKKKLAERSAAQSKVSNAVADALVEGQADVNDIIKIVRDVVEQSKMTLPGRLVGFDPENCTIDDCKTLASAMCGAGKMAEMKFLRDRLDAMIKITENTMITSKPA
jgi:hypothetical protein